ncbi:hypothetical protein E4U58_002383 [Claviceps cyperi]|nr:hypothetical protein E4U58_002383 [Claviceps cyperi]
MLDGDRICNKSSSRKHTHSCKLSRRSPHVSRTHLLHARQPSRLNASICLPWWWLQDPRIYLFVIHLNPWRLPGAPNRIFRIFDQSWSLDRIAPSGMQFESHDAMATAAFKARYMPPSLDFQAGQCVNKAIRTLHSTTTGDLSCPVSTDYHALHLAGSRDAGLTTLRPSFLLHLVLEAPR